MNQLAAGGGYGPGLVNDRHLQPRRYRMVRSLALKKGTRQTTRSGYGGIDPLRTSGNNRGTLSGRRRPTRKLFQPLLWSLIGAGVAGTVFFALNRPAGTAVTISIPSPTSTLAIGTQATPETQLVNINLASVEALLDLPGIGEVRAQAIVDYRAQEGPFLRIDQLMQVPGIGSGIYQGLRGLVTVGEAP